MKIVLPLTLAVVVNFSLYAMAEYNHPGPSELLSGNVEWAEYMAWRGPGFFSQSAAGQSPKVLWIGCSDSRVPESVITNAIPGDIFTNRNIANQVLSTDDSTQSVLDYAINHLEVEHVVVVGHTRCGGVRAALTMANSTNETSSTALERWLTPLAGLARSLSLPNDEKYWQDLAEANVKAQVRNVLNSTAYSEAIHKNPTRNITVQGWIYHLDKGLLKVMST